MMTLVYIKSKWAQCEWHDCSHSKYRHLARFRRVEQFRSLVGAWFIFFELLINGGNALSVGRREKTQDFTYSFVGFLTVVGFYLVIVVVTGSTCVHTILSGVRSEKVDLFVFGLGLELTCKNDGWVLHQDFGLLIWLLPDNLGKFLPVDRQLGILQGSRIK